VATCVIPPTGPKVVPAEKQPSWDDSQRILVQRAQQGDEQAFADLFQMHKMRVYSLCLFMTKDVADAEDLTQEAFMQAFRAIAGFRGNAAFSTWLHRIAVNTVLMKLRRRKLQTAFSLDQPVSPDLPQPSEFGWRDPALAGVIDRIALRRALKELPEGCRTILALHEVEGYEHREIAQRLHCAIGTSKSQLHRARHMMRDLLFPKKKSVRRFAAVPCAQKPAATLPENSRLSEPPYHMAQPVVS
jgi:RNA polymerase sigma-70 factor, ECF subfamily